MEHAKSIGFKFALLLIIWTKSGKINERLKLLAIHKAAKPLKKSFIKASKMMELSPEEIAVVGDQVFTDIIGGNMTGMYTIIVKPVDIKEPYYIRIKRIFEKLVLIGYKSE